MSNSNLDLDKYVHETHEYINMLASELGHPNEQQRVMIIWRAVMHAMRDRIQFSESLDLISPLPLILKGMYTMGWKFHEFPLLNYATIEEMKSAVKQNQEKYGESEFDWRKSTDEIISITLDSLEKKNFMEGQMEHIRSQLPEGVRGVV